MASYPYWSLWPWYNTYPTPPRVLCGSNNATGMSDSGNYSWNDTTGGNYSF